MKTLSTEAARKLAAAWLHHAGYEPDDKNIVGEPLLDVVMAHQVPERIHKSVFDATGVDLADRFT